MKPILDFFLVVKKGAIVDSSDDGKRMSLLFQQVASKEGREMEQQKEISFLKPEPLTVKSDDMWVRRSQLI